MIDKQFDILNSRDPIAKGFKPLPCFYLPVINSTNSQGLGKHIAGLSDDRPKKEMLPKFINAY